MKKYLIFSYSHDFIMGGIESYAIRMFNWAFNNGYNSILLLREDSKVHSNWKKVLDKNGVTLAFFSGSVLNNRIYNSNKENIYLKSNYEYVFIAADIHCFIKGYNICKYFKISRKGNLLLYIFHPYSVFASRKKILNFPYGFLMKRIRNSHLIFMDEETALSYKTAYKLDVKKECVVRLGMEIPAFNSSYIQERFQNRREEINILTITRMDFPFKGYIMGLIDDYSKLKRYYSNLRLIIIGNGPNLGDVNNKIDQLPENVRNDISVIGEVPYEELKKYFQKCYLYVGMGTTLLDASLTGLVSVVANDYQMDNKTVGFFSDEYFNLGGNTNVSGGSNFTFEMLMKQVLDWSEKEYYIKGKHAYDVVNEHYNINKVMKKILSFKGEKKKLPFWMMSVLSLYDTVLSFVQIYQIKEKSKRSL